MQAIRATTVFDGETFLDGGATVLVEDGVVVGVESRGHDLPAGCSVTVHDGTLLPGLIDAHSHLVADSGLNALDRVAGYSPAELDGVITQALGDQLAAGVTTVRDLGDRDFCVVDRRDRQHPGLVEPTIVASGPPITTAGGHCHFLGGAVASEEVIARAVAERVERGVDVVKVMASGGVNTPGTDVLRTQFSDDGLRRLVEQAHAAGLPVTAHAHGTPSVQQALDVGVDGVEHGSCVTERGFGQASDDLLDAWARSGIVLCPTLGTDPDLMKEPPAPIKAVMDRMGVTAEQMMRMRYEFVGRQHRAGIQLVTGVDSGIQPPKRHGALPFAVGDLVSAGLTVAQALATATSRAAAAVGLGERKGRVAPGYDADLVLVAGDVAASIMALHDVRSVLLQGRPVTPPGADHRLGAGPAPAR
ncbi:amidohydrolase family protein [Angustibacter luteus]|uniref:Amidohydrolase family protein n=1 Tax=Angustibacter luteus TaxID=658456 RepID=A0ABW1JFE6_9ACTN